MNLQLFTIYIHLLNICVNCRDVKPVQENYLPKYTHYHNLSQIEVFVKDLEENNPSYIKVDWTYKSRYNRPQMLVHTTNHSASQTLSSNVHTPKLKILFSYGEHSREFLPIESVFYLLRNLTEGLSAPLESHEYKYSKRIFNLIDIYIVIMMNPDGRVYVESHGNYCWRGTSMGVDLNRNFAWQYGGEGSSSNKQDEEYRGQHPFSEPECQVLTDITSNHNFDAFISFHSGIRQIYVPYADTISKKSHRKPDNVDAMLELAQHISLATGQQYKYGLAWQLNEYTADGTIFDYMAGVRKIPFSFAVELWGEGDSKGAKCFDLFNPPSEHLEETVQSIHPLYVIFFDYLLLWKQRHWRDVLDPEVDAPSLTFGYVLLVFVILLTLLVAIQNKLPICLRLMPRRRIVSLRSLSSTFSLVSLR